MDSVRQPPQALFEPFVGTVAQVGHRQWEISAAIRHYISEIFFLARLRGTEQ